MAPGFFFCRIADWAFAGYESSPEKNRDIRKILCCSTAFAQILAAAYLASEFNEKRKTIRKDFEIGKQPVSAKRAENNRIGRKKDSNPALATPNSSGIPSKKA